MCLCDVVCVLLDGYVSITRQVCVFVSVSGCVSVPGCVSSSESGCVGCCLCVDGWVCVYHEASVCQGTHVFIIIHTHIGRQQKKGQMHDNT